MDSRVTTLYLKCPLFNKGSKHVKKQESVAYSQNKQAYSEEPRQWIY